MGLLVVAQSHSLAIILGRYLLDQSYESEKNFERQHMLQLKIVSLHVIWDVKPMLAMPLSLAVGSAEFRK